MLLRVSKGINTMIGSIGLNTIKSIWRYRSDNYKMFSLGTPNKNCETF